MNDDGRRRVAIIGAVLVSVAFFAHYAARVCPDLAMLGDSAELVAAAALWGVPHPPGYPLFTALGHLAATLPLGTVPWRVHMTSAGFHAGAVFATIAAAFALTESRVAALAAGVALGLSRSFLLGSLYAEVFPLDDCLCAATLALALRARRSPPGSLGRSLFALAVCAGIAAGHHMMFALLVPALALLAFRPAATFVREDAQRALGLSAAFLVPVVVAYALVPLAAARAPYLSWGDVHDARSFARLVTRADYGGLFSPARHASAGPGGPRVAAWAELLLRSTGFVVLGGALLGVVDRVRKDPPVGLGLLFAVLVPGPVFAWLNALDTSTEGTRAYFERFTTLSHVGVALAFGAGVGLARSMAGERRRAAGVLGAALALWACARCHFTRDVDLAGDRSGIAFAHDTLLRVPDRSLVLLGGDQPINAELYVCGVERLCGDRVAFAPGTLSLPWKMAEVRRRHPGIAIPWTEGPALRRIHTLVAANQGRPVYLSPDLLAKDPLLASLDLVAEGLLLRVVAPRAGGDEGGQ